MVITTGAGSVQVVLETLRSMAAIPDRFAPDALLSELEIDSLDLVELTQTLEDKCNLHLEPADLKGVKSVRDVVEVLGAWSK